MEVYWVTRDNREYVPFCILSREEMPDEIWQIQNPEYYHQDKHPWPYYLVDPTNTIINAATFREGLRSYVRNMKYRFYNMGEGDLFDEFEFRLIGAL